MPGTEDSDLGWPLQEHTIIFGRGAFTHVGSPTGFEKKSPDLAWELRLGDVIITKRSLYLPAGTLPTSIFLKPYPSLRKIHVF